mgnify:CR=1 FL=1
MKKILSRKLWIALSGIGAVVIAAISKELAWADAVPSIAAIAVGYCVSQGWIDAKEVQSAIESETKTPE